MILVTGGAGFIGSAFIRHIINCTGYHVVNVDSLTYAANLSSIESVSTHERYNFVQADICCAASMSAVFNKYQPNVVMHLAAESHVDRSIDDPALFLQTNIIGTFVLLEAARQYWSELSTARKDCFRFHQVSTDEVYGDLEVGSPGFTESTPYNPSSPYSASKAAADHLAKAWHRTYRLPVSISNCANNYGPYHLPDKLIPLTILNALAGQRLSIHGTGSQTRDWLHVEDHARALLAVVTIGKVGETYLIGSNDERTVLEVVEMICEILDGLVPCHTNTLTNHIVSYRELIVFVDDRPGQDLRYSVDASKIKRELEWQPQEDFDTGLYKTVKWYITNKDWVTSPLFDSILYTH